MADETDAPGADATAESEVVEAELVTPTDTIVSGLPEDPDEAIAVLADAAGTAQATAAAYLEDLQRLAADFENFKKRAAREREETIARASQRLVSALMPVLDSFEQAVAQEAATEDAVALRDGMEGTLQQLIDALAGEGVERVPGQGTPFDPNVHEAVGGVAGDELVVDQVMRTGYTLNGWLLRPAMVLVAPADKGAEG